MSEITNNLQAQITDLSNSTAASVRQINSKLSSHDSSIQSLNTKAAQLLNEDQDIHEEIHELAETVDENETRITALENKNYQSQIDTINSTISGGANSLQQQIDDMDDEHHEELHELAEAIDSNETRITALENKDYQSQIDTIASTISGGANSLQQQIDDMDDEHHEEIHQLADAIDNQQLSINQIQLIQANTPTHVVLSMEEYEALGTPDPNKFYFTYEED